MGGYTITLQNRIQNGPLFGVSRFRYEEYLEWGIYLGLLSIHIRYFKMDGLRIKDGRLINDRPTSESGLAKLCRVKKEVKRMEKVSIIADGVQMGEAREQLFKGIIK
jgi:hypothetical protein